MNAILNPARSLMVFIGECTLILGDALRRLPRRPWEIQETITQMAFVGVASVPIVALTGFFSGAVISLYLSKFLIQYGAAQFLGATVGLTVLREIGPVIAGIMISARCGSAMAAQIATMAVTEQVDALRMLSVNPTNYLVIPRILACVIMGPILTLISVWAGITGGLLVAMGNGIPYETFIQSFQQFGSPADLWKGLAKAPIFGIIVAVVACQQGLRTSEGAVGVGRATTNSVVISMVLVYIANFVIATILFR